MEIIPKDNDCIIFTENESGLALCAYKGENCEVEADNVINSSKRDKEKLFDAYILIDTKISRVVEKHNVLIEDYPTIAYVRIENLTDQSGDKLELCHYIKKDEVEVIVPTSWWKKHNKLTFIVISLCPIIVALFAINELRQIFHDPETVDEPTDTIYHGHEDPTIEASNNLLDGGYLALSIPKNVSAKMYVSPNMEADGTLIDWDKVSTHITSKDTLYPKRDCKIFIHVYDEKASEPISSTDYAFPFSMKAFVQYIILHNFKEHQKNWSVKRQMFYNVNKDYAITFDVGGGLDPIVITSIYDLKQIPDYISQDLESFKIDSVEFYPFTHKLKRETIFSKEYPSIKYLGLK